MDTLSTSRPTIKDIAFACGVSEATVSYVINGKRTLRADTRERVFQAMREMNYHPSAVARGLSSKRVHTLGVLFGSVGSVDFITNPYVSGLLQGVMICAEREGFDVTLFSAQWKNAQVSAPRLRDGRTDGILAIAPTLNSDIISGLSGLGIPLVAISAGETNASEKSVCNVDVDNFKGAQLAAQHLLRLGHRHIAFLMGNADLASFVPRRAGFEAALREFGVEIAPEMMQESHFDGSLAFEQTLALLKSPMPPTAIFAGNDKIAFGVLEAARYQDVPVPERLSIVGFDDSPSALLMTPPLTTIRQPLREIGEVATQLLIERLRGNSQQPLAVSRSFDPILVERDSTASPKSLNF